MSDQVNREPPRSGKLRSAAKWVDQTIGDFFKDHKEVRELATEPGDGIRSITRLTCLLCILCAFAYAFYFLFRDAPNVQVKRVYLQKKDAYFAISRLYNISARYGTGYSENSSESQEVLDCPCTTTTISWTRFVHFYIINYTNSDPAPVISWIDGNETLSLASRPGAVTSLEDRYVVRDKVDLTIEKFCENIIIKPATRFMHGNYQRIDCPAMISALLTTVPLNEEILSGFDSASGTTNWNDPRASNFESPSLLHQKFLYSNIVRRLRAYLLEHYSVLNIVPPLDHGNATNREMFFKGMTELWLYAVDRFGRDSGSTDLQFFYVGASASAATFAEITRMYPDAFAVMLYEGQSFLGMKINWLEYYEACAPKFCDVVMENELTNSVGAILAQLGGLWTFTVVAVTLIVWPLIAILLVQSAGHSCCTGKGPKTAGPELPSN